MKNRSEFVRTASLGEDDPQFINQIGIFGNDSPPVHGNAVPTQLIPDSCASHTKAAALKKQVTI